MDPVTYHPIGIVHTPFIEQEGTPIQPVGGKDVEGTVEVLPEYAEGLRDLEGFSHIVLLYHFNRCIVTKMVVTTFVDPAEHGVFATRAPVRPNHIGMSVVRLDRVEGTVLHVRDLDILDGTPVLDIKPHIPHVDCPGATRTGWLEGLEDEIAGKRDDLHFLE